MTYRYLIKYIAVICFLSLFFFYTPIPAFAGLNTIHVEYDSQEERTSLTWNGSWVLFSQLTFNLGEEVSIQKMEFIGKWANFNLYSESGWLHWQIGRSPLKLGTGYYNSTILNHDNPSFDIARYDFTFLGIDYTKFAAFLDGKDRILFGHRFGKTFFNGNLELHAQELCLAADEYESLFNNPIPFVSYYLLQHILLRSNELDNSNINIMWAFDWKYKMANRSETYGEFFIDDLKSPFDKDNHTVPTRLAGLIGYYKPDLFVQDDDLRFEYARANRFTYSNFQPSTDFILDGECLGHSMGSDADNLILAYSLPIKENKWLVMRYEMERHGEGEIGDRWVRGVDAPTQFLTGIVETHRKMYMEYKYILSENSSFNFTIWLESVKNVDHIWSNNEIGKGVIIFYKVDL